MALSMKTAVFWDVAPCRLVEADPRFRVAYCLHRQGMEAVGTFETSANFYETARRNVTFMQRVSIRKNKRFRLYEEIICLF
jgi:hypothetical protein